MDTAGRIVVSHASSSGPYAADLLHATSPFHQATSIWAQEVVEDLRCSMRMARCAVTAAGRVLRHADEASEPDGSVATRGASQMQQQQLLGDDLTLLHHFTAPIDVYRHGMHWLFVHDDAPCALSEWRAMRCGDPSDGNQAGRGLSIEALEGQLTALLLAWLRSWRRWCPSLGDPRRTLRGDVAARPAPPPAMDGEQRCSVSAVGGHSAYPAALRLYAIDDFGVSMGPSPMVEDAVLAASSAFRSAGGPTIVVRTLGIRMCRNLELVVNNVGNDTPRGPPYGNRLLDMDDAIDGHRLSSILLRSPQVWARRAARRGGHPECRGPSGCTDGASPADDVWSIGMLVFLQMLREAVDACKAQVGAGKHATNDDDDGTPSASRDHPQRCAVPCDDWRLLCALAEDVPGAAVGLGATNGGVDSRGQLPVRLYGLVERLRAVLMEVGKPCNHGDEPPASIVTPSQDPCAIPHNTTVRDVARTMYCMVGPSSGVLVRVCGMLHPVAKRRWSNFVDAHDAQSLFMGCEASAHSTQRIQHPPPSPILRCNTLPPYVPGLPPTAAKRAGSAGPSEAVTWHAAYLQWKLQVEKRSMQQNGTMNGLLVKGSAMLTAWVEVLWSLVVLQEPACCPLLKSEGATHSHRGQASSEDTMRAQTLTLLLLQSLPGALRLPQHAESMESSPRSGAPGSPLAPPAARISTWLLRGLVREASAFLAVFLQSHQLDRLVMAWRHTSDAQAPPGLVHLSLPGAVAAHLWEQFAAHGGEGGDTAAGPTSSSHACAPYSALLLGPSVYAVSAHLNGGSVLDALHGTRRKRASAAAHAPGMAGALMPDVAQQEASLVKHDVACATDASLTSSLRALLLAEAGADACDAASGVSIAHRRHHQRVAVHSIVAQHARSDVQGLSIAPPLRRAMVPAPLRGAVWWAMLAAHEQEHCLHHGQSSAVNSDGDFADVFLASRAALAATYAAIDVDAPTCNDRQIAVDIPRCHQYDPLLCASHGQIQLLRVIKAWLVLHPRMIYWQGIDSVCAVLLSAAHGDEPLALGLLTLMMRRWVPHFFVAAEQGSMDQRLLQLSLLLRYVDPELALHLFDALECKPELFSISWFLTLFAHVLPLRKLFVLWDFIISSKSPEVVLCVACVVLMELRTPLLHARDFATAVALLSHVTHLDVMLVTAEAAILLRTVPPSVLCPGFHDPSTASRIRTSCCSLIAPEDLQAVQDHSQRRQQRRRRNGTPTSATDAVDHAQSQTWADDSGVYVLDIRLPKEWRSLSHRGGARDGSPNEANPDGLVGADGGTDDDDDDDDAPLEGSVIGRPIGGGVHNDGATIAPRAIVVGAVHQPYDTLRGWRDGCSGTWSVDGDAVLRLLCQKHLLWLRGLSTSDGASGGGAVTETPAGTASAIASAPTIVIVTDKEPEDGQSAVECLQRMGVPKVTMLLGGVERLQQRAPRLVAYV